MVKNHINALLFAVIFINSCALIGCHRGYYRRQADVEAKRLILEKAVDPRWNSSDGSIEVDPQSRMFNPFSQDHPPIPPDDAASHQLMHRVDGKDGYPHWHANGDTNYVESPVWMSYLPTNEKGQLVLNLERAYQLALIHSPNLQRQREILYQSALDVSLERFGFDSQMFTGFNSFLTTQGRLRNGTSSTTLQSQIGANGGGLDIRRAGITGANFAVGLANTILFNFAGNNTQSATSLIDFSVIQPLLRGAGRERILESLTQSERTLLANVRQLERFRRGFYLQIAIGRNPGAGPNRGGNFLGAPGSANSNAGGFFGLLEAQQRIRNQEFNVRQLEAVLEQFREFFNVDRLDAPSLKLFEVNVYSQQRALLDLKTNYQTSLDQFKLTLGLPPDVEVVIDDSFLHRFELISDQINERLISIGKLRRETGYGLNRVFKVFQGVGQSTPWQDFEWPEDLPARVEELVKYVDAAEEILENITSDDSDLLETDFKKLEDSRQTRIDYLEKVKEAIDSGRIISNVDEGLFDADSLKVASKLRKAISDPEMDAKEFIIGEDGRREPAPRSISKRARILKEQFAEFKSRIESFEEDQGKMSREPEMIGDTEYDPELYTYIDKEFQQQLPGQLNELNNLALEMSLLQAQARSNSIRINDINLQSEHAFRIANCMRRDLMNARASLVDQWRNIEFVADQLEAQVDLVFQGDIGNSGDNPFKIRYETGQLRAGFRFDSPLVRMSERNAYRNALISYQQSRRSFYQFEDSIKRNLRDIVRNVDRLKILFELDRLTVQTEIDNVEINRYEIDRPVSPNAGNSRVGTQTAQNLANAIRGLNSAQNSFLRSWVQFEVLRRNLDFDLGTMQVDSTGAWLDPGEIDSGIATRAASMMGIELDCQFCENVGFSYSADSSETIIEGMNGTEFNSLEFEANDYSAPMGNDPNVPQGDSRPLNLDEPVNGNSIEGLIEPAVIPPSEELGASSLQRSNVIPRNLFQQVSSMPRSSSKKRQRDDDTKSDKSLEPQQTEKLVVTKALNQKSETESDIKSEKQISLVKTEPPAPTIVQTSEMESVVTSKKPPVDWQPKLTEPELDSIPEVTSTIAGKLPARRKRLDETMLDQTLEQASFLAFLEDVDANESFFNELIDSSISLKRPQEEATQVGFETPVPGAGVKQVTKPNSDLPTPTAVKIAPPKASKPESPPSGFKTPSSIPDWQKDRTSLGGVLNRFRTR